MRLLVGTWTVPLLLLATARPCAAEPRIQHEPAACFLAESYPRLSAVVAPGEQVVRARLFFRPESSVMMAPPPTSASVRSRSGDALADSDPLDGGGARVPGTSASPWYAVAMTREGDTLSAVLPRPRMAAGKVRYFIEVTDTAADSVRDKEHVVEVVGAGNACGDRKVAEAVASAQVVVEVPPGAPLVPPVPQGFSPVGASAVEGSFVARKGGHKALFLALGGAALGGAAAASQLSSGDSPPAVSAGPLAPGFILVNTFPSPGGVVSVSRPILEVRLRVVPLEEMQNPTVTARLYSAAAPSRTCGTMRTPVFNLAPGISQVVRLFVLEDASPCGTVDRVQASLQDSQGRVALATGTSEPDLVISLFFAP